MTKLKIVIAVFCLFFSNCAFTQEKIDSETMYIKASALTKLSSAMEATVRYDSPPPGLSEQELLKLATKDDPALLENFTGYTLKVLTYNRHAVVLVCEPVGNVALLEDAGCTGKMDEHRWKTPAPCEFTIKIDGVCGGK
jgi:hypothetical protein